MGLGMTSIILPNPAKISLKTTKTSKILQSLIED